MVLVRLTLSVEALLVKYCVPLQEYCASEYLRMNGVYWGLTAMDLMGALGEMCRDEVIGFVSQCQHESGGFRASVGHDPSLLCTLSAIQVAHCLS